MIAEEEYAALKAMRDSQRKRDQEHAESSGGGHSVAGASQPAECSVSLVAVCSAAQVPGLSNGLLLPRELDSSARAAFPHTALDAEHSHKQRDGCTGAAQESQQPSRLPACLFCSLCN